MLPMHTSLSRTTKHLDSPGDHCSNMHPLLMLVLQCQQLAAILACMHQAAEIAAAGLCSITILNTIVITFIITCSTMWRHTALRARRVAQHKGTSSMHSLANHGITAIQKHVCAKEHSHSGCCSASSAELTGRLNHKHPSHLLQCIIIPHKGASEATKHNNVQRCRLRSSSSQAPAQCSAVPSHKPYQRET